MNEYFFTKTLFNSDELNGKKIVKKELANKETCDLYGQTVYTITLEDGRRFIAYPNEIFSE